MLSFLLTSSFFGLLRKHLGVDPSRRSGPDAISSKNELAKSLALERQLKKNKDKGDAALKSCLEVCCTDPMAHPRRT
jgi:hypothetical protein